MIAWLATDAGRMLISVAAGFNGCDPLILLDKRVNAMVTIDADAVSSTFRAVQIRGGEQPPSLG